MNTPGLDAVAMPDDQLLMNLTTETKELLHRLHVNNALIPMDAVPHVENVRRWVNTIERAWLTRSMPPMFQANGEPWNHAPGAVNSVNYP